MNSASAGSAEPDASDGPGAYAEFEVDHEGIIIAATAAVEAMLGWAPQDLVGTPLTRVIPERLHEAHRAGFVRFVTTGEMPLEGTRIRLPALHAEVGEIDIELELRRVPPGSAGVAIGRLAAVGDVGTSTRSALTAAIQSALADKLPLSALLTKCVGVAARRHGWVVASVWWIDPWIDRLRTIATWEAEPGRHPHYVETASKQLFARGEGLVGQVWASGAPVFRGDLTTDIEKLRSFNHDGLHAALFVPLRDRGQIVGVVEMLDDHNRNFGVEDQEATWGIADELGRLLADRLRREHESVHRRRIEMALSAGQMGVWSYHLDSGVVTWDSQLEQLHGLDPGAFGGTLSDFVQLLHPDDRDDTVERLLGSIEGRARFEHQYRAIADNGRRIWMQTSAAPVIDADGRLQAMTGVSFAITDRVEAEAQLEARGRQAALAADVGRALVSREEIEVRLRRTLEAVVAQIGAAFARIWTLSPGSELLELQASAGRYTHLDGGHASIKVGEYKIGLIAASRQPHLTNDVRNDPLVSDRDWAMREEMVAFAGYPLVVGDQLVGVLGLFAKQKLPQSTLDALAAIADTIAIAIQQEWSFRRMESLIEAERRHAVDMQQALRDRAHVAEVLQSSLLPPSLPDAPGILLAAGYRAGVEEVGGDFYDVVPVQRGWAFMIGDVCGRGPEAARLTALARHSLRTALLLGHGPAGSLGALNESLLAAENDGRFCTVVCGLLKTPDASEDCDAGRLTIELSVGGHPLPLIVRRDGAITPAGTPGSLLGIMSDPSHHDSSVELEPGDALVLYTDGVTEAYGPAGWFGLARLSKIVATYAGRPPDRIVAAVLDAVTEFADSASDDVAILVIAAPLE